MTKGTELNFPKLQVFSFAFRSFIMLCITGINLTNTRRLLLGFLQLIISLGGSHDSNPMGNLPLLS